MSVDTPAALADRLVEQCVHITESFFAHHAPGGRLPRTFAGHAVGADVRADIVFTVGHLAAAGVETIGGWEIDELLSMLLAEVDGVATHSFFSYRIAETLLDRGPFADHPLLTALTDAQREQVALACDSSSFVTLLDQGRLPRNYAAVLSRCEQARLALGLVTDRGPFESLVSRLRALLAENPRHALDDSNDGSGRYDIYTADIWLFCEPLADAIGPEWRAGLADALALVEAVGGPDGTAIPWGRSTGVLSIALTVELAALALVEGLGDAPDAWLRRGADAARAMPGWFGADGVVDAHRHRDQDRYRGPARRLQLTFDLAGKLAWAARALRASESAPVIASTTAATTVAAYPPVDTLWQFDDHTTARAWAYRDRSISFVLPFVGAARSHYLAAPVRPGLFEVPVDQDLPTWDPLVIDAYQRYTAAGLPTTIEHRPGQVTATWTGFAPTTDTFATERPPRLAGTRTATWTVDGRTVELADDLQLDAAPQAIGVVIPEVHDRPLTVTVECDSPHALSVIEVDGIAEWQSAWSSIARVHQLDVDPTTHVQYRIRVTPKLRIGSTAAGHHYDTSLYAPIADRVVVRPAPVGWSADGSVDLDDIDGLHLHWPEWLAFDDLGEHARIADLLDDRGIPVVWTAHNLTPHSKQPELFDPVYQLWAERAAAVIHHSEWGRAKLLARYDFGPSVEHVTIPHGHFGGLWADAMVERADAEAALGFAPCALRIGVVGAPRIDKRVADLVTGFVASGRTDVQLAVWSLAPGERLPDDPRIVAAETYRGVDAATYARRLSACDVLALPFDPNGEMLATGTVADAIGVGIPVLGTDWGFLVEYLGDAMISMGAGTPAEVTTAIDALDANRLAAARAGITALRHWFAWEPIAEATLALHERVRR